MQDNKEIESLVIKFKDGTEREVTKGVLAEVTEDKEAGEIETVFKAVNFSNIDWYGFITNVVDMGMRFGMFD